MKASKFRVKQAKTTEIFHRVSKACLVNPRGINNELNRNCSSESPRKTPVIAI